MHSTPAYSGLLLPKEVSPRQEFCGVGTIWKISLQEKDLESPVGPSETIHVDDQGTCHCMEEPCKGETVVYTIQGGTNKSISCLRGSKRTVFWMLSWGRACDGESGTLIRHGTANFTFHHLPLQRKIVSCSLDTQ